MENKSYNEVIGAAGSAAAMESPYLNGTLAAQCGLATDYYSVTHPSLPNYLAATSGATHGVANDCSPSSCPQTGSSIFSQLQSVGLTWRAYNESMPSNCSKDSTALYAPKHNPAVYYSFIGSSCSSDDVPMGTTSVGAFVDDLSNNTLPSFSFVTPNLCDDTHNCSAASGDKWLKVWVPKITSSAAYRSGKTALFITWDEGHGGASGEACLTATRSYAKAARHRRRRRRNVGHVSGRPSCHVATIVITPSTRRGTTSSVAFSHYSLLRTTERMLGLRTLLRNAGSTSTAGMRSAFHM